MSGQTVRVMNVSLQVKFPSWMSESRALMLLGYVIGVGQLKLKDMIENDVDTPMAKDARQLIIHLGE